MANSKIIAPPIPMTETVSQLQLVVANAITNVVQQINTETNTSNLDANNYRIINVQNPSSNNDAVNLITLNSAIANTTRAIQGGTIAGTTVITTLAIQISYTR